MKTKTLTTKPAHSAATARFTEIGRTKLDDVHGGDGYSAGYAAGNLVTKSLIGSMPDTACKQVGGPLLRAAGFPNAANGAEAAVRDVCAQAGRPVQGSSMFGGGGGSGVSDN